MIKETRETIRVVVRDSETVLNLFVGEYLFVTFDLQSSIFICNEDFMYAGKTSSYLSYILQSIYTVLGGKESLLLEIDVSIHNELYDIITIHDYKFS